MRNAFMDESGCLGFVPGATDYFVLGFISPESGTRLNKCIKNINAHLIRNGWNPDVEIKASNVWNAGGNKDIPETYLYKKNPAVPMEYILNSIAAVDGYLEYVVVKLDTVSAGLQTAPNAILYNYFALQLLKGPLGYFPAVELFVDRRNREYHKLLKFDGYIEGKVGIERAEKGRTPLALTIRHLHWNSVNDFKAEMKDRIEFGVRGVEAADFVCWAIKCKFEDGNDRWFKLIEKRIRWKQHLYF
jgi:Protein of unknown function (DUF3800)